MKIAIISDTHDNTAAVSWMINYLNQHSIRLAFHAGDMIYPGIVRRFDKHFNGVLHFVFGNNDGELSAITQLAAETKKLVCHNREMSLSLAGHQLYMNHYSSISQRAAASGQYDICIGGHTHQFQIQEIGAALFVNPGHTVLTDQFSEKPASQLSFVILDLENKDTEKVVLPADYLML